MNSSAFGIDYVQDPVLNEEWKRKADQSAFRPLTFVSGAYCGANFTAPPVDHLTIPSPTIDGRKHLYDRTNRTVDRAGVEVIVYEHVAIVGGRR